MVVLKNQNRRSGIFYLRPLCGFGITTRNFWRVVNPKKADITILDMNWDIPMVGAGLDCWKTKEFKKVEELNPATVKTLNEIGVPRTSRPVTLPFKCRDERWAYESTMYDIKKDICDRFGAVIRVEHCSLIYRGTWIKIETVSPYLSEEELNKIIISFCGEYGFDVNASTYIFSGKELPWTDEQNDRCDSDDAADSLFDSMND